MESRKKVLIVIDMQNDFVTGSLGTPEAQAIVPKVVEKIKEYKSNNNIVMYTKDTHYDNYLNTAEGKKLPIEHCIEGTSGHDLIPEIIIEKKFSIVRKSTFGYRCWVSECWLDTNQYEVEIIGVCTDICVITNALLIKTYHPAVEITVDASCCAGTTPEKHEAALDVMESCQINIINRNKKLN